MCYKAVDKYTLGLEFVPDCYRTHGICVKAVNAYPSTIQFVPEYYKTQEMFDKVAIRFFVFHSTLKRIRTHERCDRVASEHPFMLIYYPDRYKTPKLRDETVDDCLTALTFIPDWFVTIKMLEKLHDLLLTNDDIIVLIKVLSKVTFFVDKLGILGVDLDKIKLADDNNFDEDNPETIIHVRLLTWCNKFEKRKAFIKDINK